MNLFEKLILRKTEEKSDLEKASEDEEKKKKDNPLIQGKPLDPECGEERHFLIMESMSSGVEKYYFWVLRFLRDQPAHGLGFDKVLKIKDLFDASVTSSFHGHVGTKLSAIQQQVQQQLGTIASMLKGIYPIIRELRVSDERLQYYKDSAAGSESAEIALKSIWIEVVEQGMQNPNSVYALATKVGFLTLPDLFFSINPKDGTAGLDNVMKSLEKGGTNKKVCDVLAKKLYAYYDWREKTYKELQHTYSFKLKYLRQHYTSIKLYMNWARPYLKMINQLQMRGDYTDADLVSAFETSKLQIELLAQKTSGFKKYHPVLLVKMLHVTRPELIYTQQGQKQPVHVGRVEIVIEPYAVTQEQIDAYINHQDGEDIELLSSVDAAMAALKDDLRKYLKEANETFPEDENKKTGKPKQSMAEPFLALGGGFRELFGSLIPISKEHFRMPSRGQARSMQREKNKAEKAASGLAYRLYDVFKKTNKLYTPI
ncbi:MAG: hypothetical protein ABIB71_09040 [Candidatus Woesearchaeota archaeon]